MPTACKGVRFVLFRVLFFITVFSVKMFDRPNRLSLIRAAEGGQRATDVQQTGRLRTFNSSDGVFQFKYSDALVPCTAKEVPGGRMFYPTDSCTAYFPVCGLEASRNTLACFAFKRAKFKDYRDFEAGTFVVAEVEQATTENQCLSVFPDWEVGSRGNGQAKRINGVTFTKFDNSEGLMSQSMNVDMYRSFHKNTCYELSVNIATIDSDPELHGTTNQFSKKDWNEVHERLEQPLNSFRFRK